MIEWFVRAGTLELGPMSEESLRAMAARGELDADATVWRPGMGEWISASEQLSKLGASALPHAPGAASAELGTMLGVNLGASPWARLWARQLDTLLWVTLLSFFAGAIAPSLFVGDGAFTGRWGGRILGWLLGPLALLIDAGIYALFGNTPGKALAALKVRDAAGMRLSFGAYLARNFQMFWYGLGLALPLVSLVTLYSSYQKASHGEILPWDRAAGTQVRSASSGTARITCVAVLYLAVVTASWMYEQYDVIQRAERGGTTNTPVAQLATLAEAVRKTSPMHVDEHTRLDGATDGPGMNFTYNYTLVDLSGDQLDPSAFQRDMYAALRPEVCGSADFKLLRDLGSIVNFSYSDAQGAHVTTVSVPPAPALPRSRLGPGHDRVLVTRGRPYLGGATS